MVLWGFYDLNYTLFKRIFPHLTYRHVYYAGTRCTDCCNDLCKYLPALYHQNQEIQTRLNRASRCMDKLVDEFAQGKKLEKIFRTQ